MGRLKYFLKVLLVVCAFAPSFSHGQNLAETLRQDLFLEHYLEAARKNPRILISNLAYIIDVTTPTGAAALNEYSKIIRSQHINESLEHFKRYLPQVGIGVEMGGSLGPISVGGTLSYDVAPLLTDLVRMSLGVLSPTEIDARFRDISSWDADFIRGVGRVVYDGYQKHEGPLAKFHSLYWIASLGAPDLPPPNGSPQVYLDRASPMLRVWITAKLQGADPESRQVLLLDWEKFAAFLKDSTELASNPEQLDVLAERVGDRLALNLQSGVDSARALRDAMALVLDGVPVDQELLKVLRTTFIQEGRLRVTAPQDIHVLERDFRSVQTLLGTVSRIAAATGSVEDQRSVAFLAAMTEFSFQSAIAYSAGGSAVGLSAGLGAVAALVTMASMFSDQGPDPSVQAINAILKNQKLIVERLAGIESQLMLLRLAVHEIDAAIAMHADRTAFKLSEVLRHIEETRAATFFARDSVLASLKALSNDSSVRAAANLRKMAQDIEVQNALARDDFATKQEIRRHLTDIESFLRYTVAQPPNIMSVSLDDAVSQNLLSEPWLYQTSAVRFVVDSADYYRFDADRFRSRLNVEEQNLLDRSLAAVEGLRSARTGAVYDPHAFLRGTLLLTDAIVRFDQSYRATIDTAALCRGVDDANAQLMHLVHALPVADFAFREDSRDAVKQWNDFFRQAVSSSFMHYIYSELDYWFPAYLRDTNARELVRTYDCLKNESRHCDDHRFPPGYGGALGFLEALGLLGNGRNYVRKDLTYLGEPRGSHRTKACFDVMEFAAWSDFAIANYPSKVAEAPDGVILGLRNVCTYQFEWPPETREERRQRVKEIRDQTFDYGQAYWDAGFKGWIKRLYQQYGLEISEKTEAVQRAEVVTEKLIRQMLVAEQNRIQTHLRGYLSRDTEARRKMLEAQRFLSRHAVTRIAATSAMEPRCREAMWESHLDHLLSRGPNGTMVTLYEEFVRLLEEGQYAEAHRLLVRAADAPSVLDTRQCFLAPIALSRAYGLLELVDAHTGRTTACRSAGTTLRLD